VPAASDPDGNALNFTIQNKPSWATFSTTTGALTGTPTTSNVGTFAAITISVSDGALSVSLAPFAVQVAQAVVTNQPPVISGSPATSVTAGAAYSFAPVASDPNGNALNFTIQNKPAWASFSTATGALTGTATVGSFANIVISVSDGTASAALAAFAITVTAPVVTGSATLNWTAPTQNSDGSALSDLAGYRVYMGTSATTLVQVASITNPATGSYAVTGLTAGIWYFSVSAVNSAGAESAQTAVASKTI
jgi:hypothetical protein